MSSVATDEQKLEGRTSFRELAGEGLLAEGASTGRERGFCGLSVEVDRWLRVVVYGLSVALTSCLFAGWQQYSLILLRGGVYDWKCTPGSRVRNKEVPDLFTCPDQERAVNSLLPLASGLELAGAIVAGILLDFCGPRLCALSGSVLGFLSYIMLIYSSRKVNLYALSMAVTGIAINLIGFPALTLEDHFPTAAATTAAYVIACQCLSSIISVILWTLWQHNPGWTFAGLWWGYLLIIWIPVSIPYIILLPFNRKRSSLIAQDAEQTSFSLGTLLKYLRSLPYVVMNILSVVLMLQTSYWQLIVRSQLGIRISEFLGWTMPSQAIWALAIGRVADRVKTPIIIGCLLIVYTIIYSLVPAGKSGVQYLSVMLFNLAMSYAYTIKYSFVQERYPQKYYGTLVGVSGAVSGAGVLATNILNYIDRPTLNSILLAVLTVAALPLCIYLHFELRRFRKSPQGQSEMGCEDVHDSLEKISVSSDSPRGGSAAASHSFELAKRGSSDEWHHHVNPIEPLCTMPSHHEREFVTAQSSATSQPNN